MTKEEKRLVIKDLATRLPYNVIVHNTRPVDAAISFMEILTGKLLGEFMGDDTFELKPYLRPMDSMTEEEWDDFNAYRGVDGVMKPIANEIDWLTEHHFDYRGLIPKGLAYPALPGMYTIKTGHK